MLTVGVLSLQGDVREHVQALQAVGVRAVGLRRPAELAGLDGVVLPGGESTTIVRLLRITGLFDPLRDALSGGLPALGSCAGLILLATRVVDGEAGQSGLGVLEMTVRRNAFGPQVESFEAPVEVAGLAGGPVPAIFIRAPWVEEVGSGVAVLGRWAGRIVAVRRGVLLATAFHPELSSDLRVHQLFASLVKETR